MEYHQRKSLFTAFALVLIAVAIGFVVNYPGSGITGATTGIPGDFVVCSTNSHCDDGISCTVDSCKTGSESSFCVNSPVEYCQDGDGCCPAGCTLGTDSDCS